MVMRVVAVVEKHGKVGRGVAGWERNRVRVDALLVHAGRGRGLPSHLAPSGGGMWDQEAPLLKVMSVSMRSFSSQVAR